MRKILIGTVLILILAIIFFPNKKSPEPLTKPTAATQSQSDKKAITAVLEKEIPAKSGVKKFAVVSMQFDGNYAKVIIKPLDVVTDNAFVFLQKTNNQWKLIWGPGTDIPPSDPLYLSIPKPLLP